MSAETRRMPAIGGRAILHIVVPPWWQRHSARRPARIISDNQARRSNLEERRPGDFRIAPTGHIATRTHA
jgi:hypothetical protein